jgi:hypothetical protein
LKNRNLFLFIGIFLSALLMQACETAPTTAASTPKSSTKVDPAHQYLTDTGFAFLFPMGGIWYSRDVDHEYAVGKRPLPDGTTALALVRHGPILTPGGQPTNNAQIFKTFKTDIEAGAQGGRMRKVKNTFSQRVQNGAQCLFYTQEGEDSETKSPMTLTNDGMICLHPNGSHKFIWMVLSERRPAGKLAREISTEDENKFFYSVQFL